jgi:hypothetical protein
MAVKTHARHHKAWVVTVRALIAPFGVVTFYARALGLALGRAGIHLRRDTL